MLKNLRYETRSYNHLFMIKKFRSITALALVLTVCLTSFGQLKPPIRKISITGQTRKRPLVPPAAIDVLITGGTIITMDGSRRIIENGSIAIRNGEIVRIGTAAELRGTRARQTIN